MSYYGVAIFEEPRRADDSWVELLDSLDEASVYLQANPNHVAYEFNDQGDPTGVVMRCYHVHPALIHPGLTRKKEDR